MQDALMFTIPSDRVKAMKAKLESEERIKTEAEKKIEKGQTPKRDKGAKIVIDMSSEKPLESEQDPKMDSLLSSMGITAQVKDFFSPSATFTDIRDWKEESQRNRFYRQEIWHWMDQSISKGSFRWITKHINPVYDIHAFFNKIMNEANKATWVSHSLEVRKIFSMVPGSDIFQYYAELLDQIKLVKVQGSALGLDLEIPPWIIQSMLLSAAIS